MDLRTIVRAALNSCCLLAALVSSGTHASESEQHRLFEAGRVAFSRGDYVTALEQYEAAAAAGLSSAAVHFNIGVAAYRAGRFSRAEQAFIEAARAPEISALAHYNLGLVAQARGDHDAAKPFFRRIVEQGEDERLRALAARQLDERVPARRSRWGTYVSGAIGYDDNVALVSDAAVLEVSGRSDAFADAQAGANYFIDQHWRLDGGLAHIDYFDLDDYDLLSVHGGGRYRFASAEWTHEARLQFSYARLGGESFETRRALSFQSSRALAEPWLLRARYRISSIEGMGEYDGLDGTHHELHARLTYRANSGRYSVAYEYESNDQRDMSLATERHELQLQAVRDIDTLWSVEVDGGLQCSRYGNAAADDTHAELGLSVARTLTGEWRLLARYSHAQNDSRTPALEYEVNQISLGVESTF